MKKTYFIGLLITAALLSSCTKEDEGYDPFGESAVSEARERKKEAQLSYEKALKESSSTTSTPSSSKSYEYSSSSSQSSAVTEESATQSTTTESTKYRTTINPTDDQKQLMIVFAQEDFEDRGYKVSYDGKDSWNVVVDSENRWIITKKDKKYNRIKAIYKWDGEENAGATLLYLLINGEELLNNL